MKNILLKNVYLKNKIMKNSNNLLLLILILTIINLISSCSILFVQKQTKTMMHEYFEPIMPDYQIQEEDCEPIQ